jgi:hypothetical protein
MGDILWAGANGGVQVPMLADEDGHSRGPHKRRRPLTLFPLVALIFYEVSGGPFGTEVCPPDTMSVL